MMEQKQITCLFSLVVTQHSLLGLLLLCWKHKPKSTGVGYLSSSGEGALGQQTRRRESTVAHHPGKPCTFLPVQANEKHLENRTEPCILQVKADGSNVKVGKVFRRIYLLYIRTEVFVYQCKPSMKKNSILTMLIHTICCTHARTHRVKVNERSRAQKTGKDPNLFFPIPCTQQIKTNFRHLHLSSSVQETHNLAHIYLCIGN